MIALPITRRWWPPFLVGGYAAGIAVWPYAAALPFTLAGALWLFGSTHRWLLVFLCSVMLLPPLPVPVGDSGPHVSMVIAGAGLLMALTQLRRWRAPANGPLMALAALWGLMLLSLGPAAIYSGPWIALASLVRSMLFGVSVFIYWYLIEGPGVALAEDAFRWTRILFASAVIAAAMACADFYLQLPPISGFAPQFVWLDSGVFRRAQGLFYEASTLGNFCAFFLVMIVVSLVRRPAGLPISRLWLGGGACVFGAALLFSFSRASVVNLAVALTALAYLRGRIRLPVRAVAVLGAAAVAAAAVLQYLRPEFVDLYIGRLTRSVLYFSESPESVLSGRLHGWQSLLEFATQNPQHVLFGIGYKTLPYTSFLGEPVVADNAYLGALVEMGVAGLAALLALNVAILRAARRAANSRDPQAAFFGAWIFCFWAGESVQMLSGDLLTYWRVLPLYFWALAMAVTGARASSLRG